MVVGVSAVVGTATVLVGLDPTARSVVSRQIELSVTRQPTAFVELAFPSQGQLLQHAGDAMTITLRTRSHRPDVAQDRLRIVVDDAGTDRVDTVPVVLAPGPWQQHVIRVDDVSARWRSVRVELIEAGLHLQWRRVSGRQEIKQ